MIQHSSCPLHDVFVKLFIIQVSFAVHFRCPLDLAHGNHLLSQIVLVLADRAIPPFDRLVLAHHDVFGDLIEQSGTALATYDEQNKRLTGSREKQRRHLH